MTDSSPSSPSQLATETLAYAGLWAQSLAQVLSQISSTAITMEAQAELASGPAAQPEDLLFLIVSSGGLAGEMGLRIPRPVALGLAQTFLSETPDAAAEFKEDHREAVLELVRQVAGYVASGAKPRWGEVQCKVEAAANPVEKAVSGWLSSSGGAALGIQMEWQGNAALAEALGRKPSAPQEAATPPVSPTEGGIADGNLELLMEVGLEVTLRFGGRSMLLREILELGAGSVVELDRRVEEPADLLLDGRIIARGEVVVVDGNYGLRVREVLSPRLAA